jgi:hypothetical protein
LSSITEAAVSFQFPILAPPLLYREHFSYLLVVVVVVMMVVIVVVLAAVVNSRQASTIAPFHVVGSQKEGKNHPRHSFTVCCFFTPFGFWCWRQWCFPLLCEKNF